MAVRRRAQRGLTFLVTFALVCAWAGSGVRGQILQCAGTDGCRCTMSDTGGVIDISSIGNSDGSPRWNQEPAGDNNKYSFNPCHPFTEGACVDQAACQITAGGDFFPTGDANTASWSYDGINAVVYYDSLSGGVLRQTYVSYTCDPTADPPVFTPLGELGVGTYYMQVNSKCACVDACEAGSASEPEIDGLSIGSVLLISFFALFLVYVLAGVAFNKTRKQAVGVEVVPNVDFWKALPGLVKDGTMFVVGKVRGGKSGYSEV